MVAVLFVGAFGSLTWNLAEDKLAYVAEKNKPKTGSYFEEKKCSSEDKDKILVNNNNIPFIFII